MSYNDVLYFCTQMTTNTYSMTILPFENKRKNKQTDRLKEQSTEPKNIELLRVFPRIF